MLPFLKKKHTLSSFGLSKRTPSSSSSSIICKYPLFSTAGGLQLTQHVPERIVCRPEETIKPSQLRALGILNISIPRFIIIHIPNDYMATTKVSLKLFIDKKRQRVLFAEADKEFVDFILSFFTLPVGAVTKLLKEEGGMLGCLPSLYRSFENLSVTHIEPDKDKGFLLEPKVFMPGAKLPLLLPSVASTFRQLYRCPKTSVWDGCDSCYTADDDSPNCPNCASKINQIVTFMDPPCARRAFSASEVGYVKGSTATYLVMDDLEVKALSTSSLVTLLTQFNVKDVGDIEEKVFDVGLDEGVKLLKASLQSSTALTDVFVSTENIKTEDSLTTVD